MPLMFYLPGRQKQRLGQNVFNKMIVCVTFIVKNIFPMWIVLAAQFFEKTH